MSLELFEKALGCSIDEISAKVQKSLYGAHYGDAFFEISKVTTIIYDNGAIKSVNQEDISGIGLRYETQLVVSGLNIEGFDNALNVISPNLDPDNMPINEAIMRPKLSVVPSLPVDTGVSIEEQINFVEKTVAEAHKMAEADGLFSLEKVKVSYSAKTQHVLIVKPDGSWVCDTRPLCHVRFNTFANINDKTYIGFGGDGGTILLSRLMEESMWKAALKDALKDIYEQSIAKPLPVIENPTIILPPNWMAVWLHEAVGHPLEGDNVPVGESIFIGKVGQQIASKGVNIYDDGTMLDGNRGSLNVDDEGNIPQKNLLVKDGILQTFLYDEKTAFEEGCTSTGNGRRENYTCRPIVRMTNTYMEGTGALTAYGKRTESDIISSVKEGIMPVYSSGGSVEPLNGMYKFRIRGAYYVKNGEIQYPIKCPAEFSGLATKTLMGITAMSHEKAMGVGLGSCGKGGQSVPVGLGQPMMIVEGLQFTSVKEK